MISAVVLTKNEEGNIERCLTGLCWCDEILVIDDDSSDNTLTQISKIKSQNQNLNLKIIKRRLKEDFSGQRNFALQQAQGEWVLFVDADEVVTPKLAEEITMRVNQSSGKESNLQGFYLKRLDFFLGKWLKHGEIGHLKILRLARKEAGRWTRNVDEIWQVKGLTQVLHNPLLHYSHSDLTQFLTSINIRSTLNTKWLFDHGNKLSFFEWLKPAAKFVDGYLLKLGFLDGLYGFVFAVLMSFHSFLVRGKLYLLLARAKKVK